MDSEPGHVGSRPLEYLIQEMRDKDYRDQYVESFNRQLLARQMRGFRGDQSQAEYGITIDKSQTQVARYEDPTYGWQTRTVFEIARKQNVAAIVCLVDFETFLRFETATSESLLTPQQYNEASLGAYVDAASSTMAETPLPATVPPNTPMYYPLSPAIGIPLGALNQALSFGSGATLSTGALTAALGTSASNLMSSPPWTPTNSTFFTTDDRIAILEEENRRLRETLSGLVSNAVSPNEGVLGISARECFQSQPWNRSANQSTGMVA
jgi:hypothetical protein